MNRLLLCLVVILTIGQLTAQADPSSYYLSNFECSVKVGKWGPFTFRVPAKPGDGMSAGTSDVYSANVIHLQNDREDRIRVRLTGLENHRTWEMVTVEVPVWTKTVVSIYSGKEVYGELSCAPSL